MRRVLPKSHYFPGKLSKAGIRPVSGGSADVWRVEDDRSRPFAAKVFRANEGEDHKVKASGPPTGYQYSAHSSFQRYYKEVTVWKQLDHPNVMQTLGAGPDIAELCVISLWMPEGSLLQYLSKNPGANRASMVSVHFARASARTEFYIQDGRSRGGAVLPPFKRRRSRRLERGEAH